MTTPDSVRARLTQRYNELSERLTRLNEDRQHRRQFQSENWTERAAERENDEVLDRLAESTFGEIAKLRHAFERLDQGKYGICEDCGKTIGPERMRLVPYATYCLSCLADKKCA